MPYITSVERIGIAKGERRGFLASIEVVLEIRFGPAGLALLPEVRAIEDVRTLEAVLGALKTVATPDELRALWQPSAPSGSGG
jgi:hypothetical protein